MFKFKYHIIVLVLIAFAAVTAGVYLNKPSGIPPYEAAEADTFDTEAGVGNSSPAINQTPADDSDSSPPTDIGSDVTFTGKAIDVNGDNYYMAFCSSDQITHGGASAPTCNTDDEWAISGSTASNVAISSVTYETGTNSNAETNDCTSGESCPWYAFVCDAVVGGSCFPANGSGDQGLALGTITLSDIPADEDDITIDSIIYEFDTTDGATCTGGEDVCVDISVSASEQDAAQELADAETGASSHMTARGAVVYVYADSEGTGGNSIGMTIGTCANCSLSGATLSGGDATGQSPFYINHAPTFGTVNVTDTGGGDIQPGEMLQFTLAQADIADSDTDGTQDTINMYICTDATSSFNYSTNTCTGGATVCSDTSVDPTSDDATCDESANNLVPPSDTGGTENFKVYVEDSHDFAGTGTNQQSYTITNTAPTHDDPELAVHMPTLPNSVGYWQFEDGTSATSLDDETSNGNDGSCSTYCPDWEEEGYSGGAYDFNGSDDYIDMGDQDSLDFGTGDFTVSAWVNTVSSANPMVVAGKYSAYPLYVLRINSGVFHSWIAYDSNNSIFSSDGAAINDGEWHHVVAVFDRDGDMTRYVDGAVYGSTNDISGLSSYNINTDNTFRVGATTGQNFDGLIDEVHVYDRALTADEIEAMYNDTTTGDADLVSEWTFNDGPDGFTQAMNYNVEGNWDTDRVSAPTVIKDGDTYKMWYSGNDSTRWRILYTTSTDGKTWTTPVQALANNQEGNWDTENVNNPSVIKDGDTYKMWFNGKDSTNNRILYTTSTDGTTWTTPQQALNYNVEGSWDTTHASAPSVIKDGSTYKMWYGGFSTKWRILYSTSTDGVTWTTPQQNLDVGQEGNWDTAHVYNPDVLKDGSTYKMWYSGSEDNNTRTLYTTSTDGINWETPVQCLAHNQEGNWDTTYAYNNDVIKDGKSYKMWYTGYDGTNYRILYTKINYMDEEEGYDATAPAGVPVEIDTGGKVSNAIDFNGSSEYITVSDNTDLSITGDATLSAWVKLGTTSAEQTILGKWDETTANNDRSYRLWIDSSNNLNFSVSIDGSAVVSHTGTTTTFLADTWYHVTGVYDNAGTMNVYVNGSSDASQKTSGVPSSIDDNVSNLYIGGKENTAGAVNTLLDGFIDEVRIYNSALSATEVLGLYNFYNMDSNMDISVTPLNIADHDSDTTTTIVNWKKDSSSIYDLLMPFDSQVTDETVDAVLDYSGNANHGTLGDTNEAPTWTSSASCVKGGCYDFNGSDERLEVAASTSLNSFSAMSVEAWINIDDTSTGQDGDAIVMKYIFSGGLGGFGFALGYTEGSYAYDGPIFGIIENFVINYAQMSSMPSLDTWHHMVGTYDGSTIKLYVDGDLEDSTATAFGSIDSTGGDLYIGGEQGQTRWFNGMIDEVRMYDYAISAEQVAQNYNNGKPVYNTIVNQEIDESDTSWEAYVTINDAQSAYSDSEINLSNTLDPGSSEPVQNFPSARAHALVDTNSAGYWQLEYGEYSTQSFDDETSNGNDMECDSEALCPVFTPEGAIGGGYEFDGTNDFIYTGDSASLSVTGDLTISAWVKPDTVSAEQTIVSKWEETTGVDDRSYRLWIDSSNNLNFSLSTDGSAVVSHTGTTTTFAADTWYHVTGVYDNAGTMDVYVDGSVDATQKDSGVPASIDDNASALAIGIKANTAGDPDTYFDGIIDEVHVYDRALTATEITNLYNSTSYVYGSYNLGVGGRDISDADDDTLYATVDWRESDTSIAVLNMSFNEEVTTVGTGDVNDYSTYGNDFTLGGGAEAYKPTWTGASTCANNSGGCYDFNGTNNYMLDYDSASSSVTGDLTVEAWLKLGTISAEQTILGKWDETTTNDDRSYRLWIDSSNNLNFSVSTDGSAVVSHTGTTTTFGTTNWYHIVGVYDNAGTMDVYVDGSVDATQKASGVPGSIDDNASNLYIGAKENTSGTLNTLIDGYIDEVRVYNTALSADQITANYNEGIPNYQSIAYGETTIGDVWTAELTIAEGNSEESVTLKSNDLEILGFSTLPYESPESSTTTPTNEDDNVVIKATANVAGTSQWYLAICQTDAITAGDDAAPTCDEDEWAISAATTDEAEATATYTTLIGDNETNNWYAFACDKVSGGGTCSASSQGSGVTGSPFTVNHRPSIGTVNIGDTTGGTGTIEAGDDVFFNVVVTDTDTSGGADTIDMHVCQTNSFTPGSGCDSNQTICSTTGNASGVNAECDSGDLSGDLSGTYNDTGTSSGQKTVYIFLEDNHDLQDADTNTQNYTLSNTVPAFTDGPFDGLLWSGQSGGSEVDQTLFGVYFYDANTGWISGAPDASPPFDSDGVILKTTDGGTTWTPQESEVAEILYGINFISSTVGWIVGDGGTILKTTNGGATWTPQTSGEAGAVLIRVQFVDADNGWVVGMDSSYNAIILKTENGGTSWTTVKSDDTTSTYYGIHFIDDAACLADADDCQGWVTGGDFSGNEYIYYTDDGGATWNAQSSTNSQVLLGVHFYDEDVGWAVGNSGTILKTIDGGTNWGIQTSNTGEHLMTIYFLDADNGWAVGENGATVKTTNGGTAWSVHAIGTDDNLNNVFFVDSSNGWAVGASGTILKNTGTVVGSSSTNPTNAGSNVNFSATATDANGEQYYLAICKTDAVTAGNNAAPTCDGGAWGYSVSLSADSGAEASTYYGAAGGDAESNAWYAFVCDKVVDNAVCSSSDQGTGDSGSPFVVNHAGTFGTVTITDSDEQLNDGDMEASGTTSWTANNSAVLTKETGTPHGGSQVLRVAYGGESNPSARQDVTNGKEYRLTGWARGDGTGVPRVVNGASVWTGTSSTSWQYFNETYTASATQFYLSSILTGSGHVEYDDVVLVETDIKPGDTLSFSLPQAQIADSDTSGTQDTINMYICTDATSSFDYINDSCLGGSLVCSDTGVDPTNTDATCDESGNNLVPIPTAHGSANVKVYVEDSHDFAGTGTNQQSYDVEDVAPELTSYSTGDSLTISAGGYDTMTYSVSLYDNNGDNDVTDLEMVFFDDDAVNNDCSADDNDCVIENIAGNCAFTGQGAGSDKDLGADCDFTVWFNSNATSNWEVHAKPTDGLGQETGFADSTDDNVVAALQGITVVESSIAYGTVEIGGTSATGMETSMGNMGNQVIDMMVDGDDMCIDSYQATCPGSYIPLEQQKWHHNSSTFDWDDAETGAGPWILEDTASTGGDTDGCLNRDIGIRDGHSETYTNESMYWKLRIPYVQAAGDYVGLNTFTTTSSSSCSGTQYD